MDTISLSDKESHLVIGVMFMFIVFVWAALDILTQLRAIRDAVEKIAKK